MHFDTAILKQCWFLAGPTASGKSDVALELAERIGAEIIALDSMSLYRRMDVGTAKPSAEMRARVPHHLVDVIEPYEEFSLAQYVSAAHEAAQDIISRNRVPLFAGGTGLYLRGVLRGVFQGPSADWDFRRQLEAEAFQHEPDWLHDQLSKVDPATAARLHANDTRRLVRALEVHHLTGRPLSEQQRQAPLPIDERPQHVLWLSPPRDWLYDRINRRVDAMIAAGLSGEVRRLLAEDRPLSHTARQALGYKEVIDCLSGLTSESEAIDQIKTRTRQFAKRQHTWFRNLEECREFPITGAETPANLAARIAALHS